MHRIIPFMTQWGNQQHIDIHVYRDVYLTYSSDLSRERVPKRAPNRVNKNKESINKNYVIRAFTEISLS